MNCDQANAVKPQVASRFTVESVKTYVNDNLEIAANVAFVADPNTDPNGLVWPGNAAGNFGLWSIHPSLAAQFTPGDTYELVLTKVR